MKLIDIASAINARLDSGSPETQITGVAGIEHAAPGQLTFVSNPKYAAAAKTTKASAVIVAEDFPAIPSAMLRSKNPYLAWAKALELFYRPPQYAPSVHPTAVVHPTAKVGKNAHLGPYVVIDEGVEIGDNAVLLAHVVIYRGAKIANNFFAHAHAVVREFCQLGDNVLLQNGVVVGSDGFGFAKDDSGHWHKIVQSGTAVLENDVELQANTCIDRASIGETRIARGAKLDNMVQVGHSCTVGQDTLLCAQVGLAGTTDVGNNVILAGQVGVAGHCKIGDGVIAIAQSGIPHDVPAGKMISGAPAIDFKLWLKCCAVYAKLPDIAKAVRRFSDRD
ncbi:MAG: UDP-3-O-(3-hydroxymyristoyl)glucosamine N-acyltransferase [Acidobacteriales bacterium]|nr:UDP-3-O-(3-hydroxymyristoyl)glucosamine N-acyltransferase [Candidatus Koribacter versatilis]MBI3647103.1 UDP-3-O-(3-hydroxymyristoyl)glucosamine N-acyltransferase [Terriglobales bacterium]